MLLSKKGSSISLYQSDPDRGEMEPPYAHAFVVKLWLERREIEAAQPEWRGRIDHVQSAKRIYFRDLAEIPRFIQAFLEGADRAFSEDEQSNQAPDDIDLDQD